MEDELNHTGKSFYDLEVWKKSRMVRNEILQLVTSFPVEEKYRLADQLTRSVRSIAACIAEGHGRYTLKDQIHYCIMARGSVSESLNHLIDAFDQGYINDDILKKNKDKLTEIYKMLNGYIAYLKKNNALKK